MQDRRYLRVPYADKNAVKAVGGLWDGLVCPTGERQEMAADVAACADMDM